MNEHEHQPNERVDVGAAEGMADEALRRYKDIPTKEDLHLFSIEKLFAGRLDRENYIYGLVGGVILGTALSFVPIIGWILLFPLGVIGIAIMSRRFRDIGMTGWLGLLGIIPVLGFLAALYLAVTKESPEAERFGPKPDPKRRFYRAILNI